MKTLIINSLITSLLLLTFLSSYAEDANQPPVLSTNSAIKETTSIGQYVLPPPSPFFGSDVTAVDTKIKETENSSAVETTEVVITESTDTNRRIFELEAALKENQEKTTSLLKELYATAKNSDFEHEMYEKTMTVLQQKIDNLKNKILKQDSAELTALKNTYKARNDEVVELKKQLTVITDEKSNSVEAEIATLRSAFTSKSKEAEEFKVQIAGLTEKLVSHQQTQTKLNDLQNTVTESNKRNALLKSEIVKLDDENKSLKSQFNKMQQEASQNTRKLEQIKSTASAQTQKLGLLDQSTAKLASLKRAYKECTDKTQAFEKLSTTLRNDNLTLKDMLTTDMEDNNSSHNIESLNNAAIELTALKSAYKDRNTENNQLKEKIFETEKELKSIEEQLATSKTEHSALEAKQITADTLQAELEKLKNANKTLSDENSSLSIKLNEHRTLKSSLESSKQKLAAVQSKLNKSESLRKSYSSKLKTLQSEAANQVRQLTSLSSAAKELAATKSAYNDLKQEKVVISSVLKKLKNTNKTLSDENSSLSVKLNEHRTLKSSLDSSTQKLAAVESKLDKSEDLRKSLSSKLKTIQSESANQARQLTSLSSVAKELAAIKSAYNDLKQEKMAISSELETAILDTDNDGVANRLDKCPSTPQGSSVDKTGCVNIADADGDKVADVNDLCPNTVVNTEVNTFGCAANNNINLEGVNFNLGSDQLTANSLPIINSVATTLKQNPSIEVEIAGFTDNLGAKSINRRLSQRRANSVAKQLIDQGVDADRITAKGYGESNPVAANDTEASRLKNRRVELKIR